MEYWEKVEMEKGNIKDNDEFTNNTINNIGWFNKTCIDHQFNAICEMYQARYDFLCEHSESKEDLEIAKAAIGTSVNAMIPAFPSEYFMR